MGLGLAGYSHAQSADDLVVMYTEQGMLVIELFPDDAPNHVANFASLAADGFYDQTLFHRIITGFMIQGGDPNTRLGSGAPESSWGTGGPDANVAAEFNDIMHNRGIVSMARSTHPDSAGSQFFIVHQNANFLDGQYTVFGRLATQESYDTLDAIAFAGTDSNDRPIQPDSVRIIAAEVLTRSQAAASGIDLLDQPSPARTQQTVTTSEPIDPVFTDESLNLSIVFPEGWVIQTTRGGDLPNIVAVGPLMGVLPPNMAIYVENATGRSLDDVVESKLADLEEYAELGTLEILDQERATINGREVFLLDAIEAIIIAGQPVDARYQEATLIASDTIYTFLHSNEAHNFDSTLPLFEESLQSFDVLEEADAGPDETPSDIIEELLGSFDAPETDTESEPESTSESESPLGGGCLIATAAFGSELAPQVQQLRELRDSTLVQTDAGSSFMNWFNTIYYSFSPYVADYERENPAFRELVRLSITPTISVLSLLNHVDMDTEAEVVAYGTAVILLVLAVYTAPPLVAFYTLRWTTRRRRASLSHV